LPPARHRHHQCRRLHPEPPRLGEQHRDRPRAVPRSPWCADSTSAVRTAVVDLTVPIDDRAAGRLVWLRLAHLAGVGDARRAPISRSCWTWVWDRGSNTTRRTASTCPGAAATTLSSRPRSRWARCNDRPSGRDGGEPGLLLQSARHVREARQRAVDQVGQIAPALAPDALTRPDRRGPGVTAEH
jgi:hypothetical protein